MFPLIINAGSVATDPARANVQLHLPLEDDLADASAAARTVTNNGGVSLVSNSPPVGTQAASFNGTTQSLSVADAAALRPGTGDFQIDCWFETHDTSGSSRVVWSKGTSTGGLYLEQATGPILRVVSNGGALVTLANPIVADNWYFVSIMRENGYMVIQLDDDVVYAAANSVDYNATDAILIGATGGLLDGEIKDFRWTVGAARIADIPTDLFPTS